METAPPAPVAEGRQYWKESDQWLMFHGDMARSGRSPARAIQTPRIRWKAKVGIQGWLNSPVVSGDLVLAPSSGTYHNRSDAADGLYAFNLKTGAQQWHRRLPKDANAVAVTLVHALVTADDGYLRAVDLATGKELWKQRGKGKMYTHPLVVGWRAIVGDAEGNLRAYRAVDGAPQWEVKLQGAIRGGAASDGERIYAVSQQGEAVAVNLDGKVIWKGFVERPTFSGKSTEAVEAYSVPIIDHTRLIIPFARDTYYDWPAFTALDITTGQILWQGTGAGHWGNVRSTPALVDGQLIYGEPYSGDVAALRSNDGVTSYRHQVGRCYFPQWASPAAAGQTVYLPRFDGTLYAISASDGKVLWQVYLGKNAEAGPRPVPETPPTDSCQWEVDGKALLSPIAIAHDGTVLVGSEEGYLYAIDDAGWR